MRRNHSRIIARSPQRIPSSASVRSSGMRACANKGRRRRRKPRGIPSRESEQGTAARCPEHCHGESKDRDNPTDKFQPERRATGARHWSWPQRITVFASPASASASPYSSSCHRPHHEKPRNNEPFDHLLCLRRSKHETIEKVRNQFSKSQTNFSCSPTGSGCKECE